MSKKQWIILFLILGLGIFLRFWKLGETPKGFYCDEASLGYSAYSILNTGKDEYGENYPLLFRSFTTFQAPVYTYMLVPIYKLFEMNVWSTRLLSALAGVLGIWFGFWLIKNLSKNINLALIFALLVSISPWQLIFSRTSYETNLSLAFLTISLWAFYKFKKNNKWLILCGIMSALSFLTYHSERIIVPLLFMGLFIKDYKIIFDQKNIKTLIFAVILGLVLIFPTVKLMTTPGFLSRVNSLSIFSNLVKQPWGFDEKLTGWKNIIFNNPIILQTREFGSLYFSYFSPRYLFGIGDPGPRSSYPDLAPFYLWQLPFFVYGVIWLFKKTKNEGKNFKFLIILMLLIAPIPASITRDPFSSIRALPLAVPLLVLVSIGVSQFIKKYKQIGIIILTGLVVWSLGRLYLSVFKFNDYFRGYAWEEGIEEMVKNIKDQNLPIVVDSTRGEIYSQILFFTKADPNNYQLKNFEVNEKDYYTNMNRAREKQIGKITIRPLIWEKDIFIEQIIVGDLLTINENQMKEHCLSLLFEIKDKEGKVIYRAVKTHPKDKMKYVMGDTLDGKIINSCKISD